MIANSICSQLLRGGGGSVSHLREERSPAASLDRRGCSLLAEEGKRKIASEGFASAFERNTLARDVNQMPAKATSVRAK